MRTLIPSAARNHGGMRRDPIPRWIVIHDAEAASAIAVAKYFQMENLKKPVSAHVVVDDNYIVRCVPDEYVAYTAGPHANAHSLQIELAGYASYSEDGWWDKHEATLYNAALVIAKWSRDYGIPIRLLFGYKPNELAMSDSRGITTHEFISKTLGGTTHTDPGKNFPLAKFIAKCVEVSLFPMEYQLV